MSALRLKTGKSGVVFFSREVTPLLLRRIKNLGDDDRVFSSGTLDSKIAGRSYHDMLVRCLEKC